MLERTFNLNMREEVNYPIRKDVDDFNYVAFHISSTLFVKLYMVVELDNGECVFDVFFVENRDYDLKCFFRDKNGRKIVRIIYFKLQNLENKRGLLTFKRIDLMTKPEFPTRSFFFGNQYMAAGFDLSKGCAISFITSKIYEIREAYDPNGYAQVRFVRSNGFDYTANANLMNNFDKGRLLQQSYYGTNKPPYQIGISFENLWRYNPIQGGDKYNNLGHIVDYSITEKSLYLKLRPLDWAKDNFITDSYMEIEYRFENNSLIIDNRFIDFSMLDHTRNGIGRQEMPAFYPVASLRNYVYLSSRDKLVTKTNLGFWGKPENYENLLFEVKDCWSGWFNDQGYGIAICTPHIDRHYAGSYLADERYRLPSSLANPVNYIAGITSFDLESLQPVQYTCKLAIGNIREIQREFKGIKH